MGARLFLAGAVGIIAGVALTRQIILNDSVRIWLVNAPSLVVWAAALITGFIIGFITPRYREAWTAAISILVGSLFGIVIFGTGLGFSLADEAVLSYLLSTLVISGVCLMVVAAAGGGVAATIRRSQEEESIQKPYHPLDERRGHRGPPDRY